MNKIKLDGVFGLEIESKVFKEKLNTFGGQDVEIFLNSQGGVLFEGVEMFNAARAYKGKITITAGSIVASIASYFAMAADEFLVQDNTSFMIHNAHTVTQGDYIKMSKTAKTLEGVTNLMRNEYQKRSGKPFAEIKSLLDKESYFFGDEIVNAGFASRVINTSTELDKVAALEQSKEIIAACGKNCKKRFEDYSDDLESLLKHNLEQKLIRAEALEIYEKVKK